RLRDPADRVGPVRVACSALHRHRGQREDREPVPLPGRQRERLVPILIVATRDTSRIARTPSACKSPQNRCTQIGEEPAFLGYYLGVIATWVAYVIGLRRQLTQAA